MFKRISATVILALIILGVPAATSASHDNQNEEERTPRRDIIWQGLCVGASLDLSRASQERCTRTAHSGDERQRNKYDYKHDKHHYDYKYRKKDHEADRKEKDKYRHEYDYRDRRDSHDYRDRDSHNYRNEPTTPAPVQYAALGDSIAAGLGLESSAGSNTRCGRSHSSYANIVAEQRGLELAHRLLRRIHGRLNHSATHYRPKPSAAARNRLCRRHTKTHHHHRRRQRYSLGLFPSQMLHQNLRNKYRPALCRLTPDQS